MCNILFKIKKRYLDLPISFKINMICSDTGAPIDYLIIDINEEIISNIYHLYLTLYIHGTIYFSL